MLGDFLSCFKDLKKENRDLRLLCFLMAFDEDCAAPPPTVAERVNLDGLPSAII